MSQDGELGPETRRLVNPAPQGSPATQAADDPALPYGFPRKVGQYLIKRVIAVGGMGAVLEGVQEHPRRPVAIKIMKQGVASGAALRRFEYESQILARLSHPGIAQVYESGTHKDESGEVPFFAMEYLPNARSITAFAVEKNLSTRARLELFVQVCDAVHCGHQKGVIHRDLKPGNILVDSHGRPRVIDFGVARATDSDMAVATVQTDVGELLGTLQYMSPEQCEADPHDIDIRSDVYALGVVLYHLLCGRLPYDLGVRMHEATRVIREDPPTRPSDALPTLRGELETILLRALEKDRERRYQSALALAEDIRRYLAGEAIVARPPSFPYQLRVFARRNKALLGAVAAVFAVLVGAAVFSTALFLQARASRIQAEMESAKLQSVLGYVKDVMLSADPVRVGQRVQVEELLRSYAASVEDAFTGQPEVEARVRSTIGLTYRHLSMFEIGSRFEALARAALDQLQAALEIRRKTLGEGHPDTLESLDNLAMVLQEQARLFEAEPLRRQALEVRRKIHGADHPTTLAAMYGLVNLLQAREKFEEAESLSLETLELRRRVLGEEDPATLESMGQYASMLQERGRLEEAEELKRRVLATSRRLFGENAGQTGNARCELASALLARGQAAAAVELFDGTQMPADLGIVNWLNGETVLDPERVQILVFWESWCPYAYVVLDDLEKVHGAYRDRGLQVVGLARFDMGTREEDMLQVIRERKLSWPTARVNDTAWYYFGHHGVPSAVAIRNGKLVWKGHPNRLTRSMLDGLVAGLD